MVGKDRSQKIVTSFLPQPFSALLRKRDAKKRP